MNHIAAKHIKTCYDDTEYYWIIDDTPITVYIDQYVQLMDRYKTAFTFWFFTWFIASMEWRIDMAMGK